MTFSWNENIHLVVEDLFVVIDNCFHGGENKPYVWPSSGLGFTVSAGLQLLKPSLKILQIFSSSLPTTPPCHLRLRVRSPHRVQPLERFPRRGRQRSYSFTFANVPKAHTLFHHPNFGRNGRRQQRRGKVQTSDESRRLEMRWSMGIQLRTMMRTAKKFMMKVRPERMAEENRVGREGKVRGRNRERT